jgi:hypothetical protein
MLIMGYMETAGPLLVLLTPNCTIDAQIIPKIACSSHLLHPSTQKMINILVKGEAGMGHWGGVYNISSQSNFSFRQPICIWIRPGNFGMVSEVGSG